MPRGIRFSADLQPTRIDGSESDAGWNSNGHCTSGDLAAGETMAPTPRNEDDRARKDGAFGNDVIEFEGMPRIS
jgi:hypothetical protein